MARQTFGDDVRYYRTLRGLGQEELGHRIGKSVPTISRIENGADGVPLATILALAVALDADIKDLMDVETPVIIAPQDNEILVALLRDGSQGYILGLLGSYTLVRKAPPFRAGI